MAETPISVLFLYTEKSIEQHNPDFDRILHDLGNSDRFDLKTCMTDDAAEQLLEASSRNADKKYQVVIVHFHSSEGNLWRRIFYKTKSTNTLAEVIVIVADLDKQDLVKAGQVLSGGCFAFFQYTFSSEVLFGYIEAAQRRYENRQVRTHLLREISGGVITPEGISTLTVEDVAIKIANQLKTLTQYDNITIVLLKKGRPGQGYLRKLVYTNLDRSDGNEEVNWRLLGPTGEDRLVSKILDGDIERRIFPNPREDPDIKDLFDAEHETPTVNSWIALPLRHAGTPIGLITMDGFKENQFNYETINELFLEQIANQAATAIRYAEKDEVYQRLGYALNALNSSTDLNEILQKLAEQACKLVGGLFSYIVVPDQAQTRLEFRGTWSRDHERRYVDDLENAVVFTDPNDRTVKKPGFLLPPYNEGIWKKGITTLAFTEQKTQLLEHIRNGNYEEISMEARNSFYPLPYLYTDKTGKEYSIIPASDIAIPILLDIGKGPGSSNAGMKVGLGVINVEHKDPFAFTKEQISALEQLAEFAAIAIQNRKNQDFVNTLYNLGDFPYTENISFNQLESYLDQVAGKIREVTKSKRVTVHSIKDNKSIFIGQTEPKQLQKKGSRWGDLNEGHTFWSVRNRKPVIINDTEKYKQAPEQYQDIFDQRYLREDNTPIEINEETTDLDKIRALVCIPMLLANGDVVGVIWMLHEVSPNYTKNEIELLQKFAAKIANTLNVVETITFLKIENEIGMTHDKESVLQRIVDIARDYFGLRGAAIYEANPRDETLTRVKSNIKQFYSVETISYKKESPQGLAGHLMRGIDMGGYPYADGYCHIPEYTLGAYPHAIPYYNSDQILELGSVVGIRMPTQSDPANAVGVLIIADEIGRKYSKSKMDLLRFADIAGKCLKVIEEEKAARAIPEKQRQSPEERLKRSEQKFNRYFDFTIVLFGVFFALAFLFLSWPFQGSISGVKIETGIKIFVAFAIVFSIWQISPRLRRNAIIAFLIYIVFGVIPNLISKFILSSP